MCVIISILSHYVIMGRSEKRNNNQLVYPFLFILLVDCVSLLCYIYVSYV